MENSYRMTAPQALDHAKTLNDHLDESVAPGAGSVTVLVVALALRIVEDSLTHQHLVKYAAKIGMTVIEAAGRLYKMRQAQESKGE